MAAIKGIEVVLVAAEVTRIREEPSGKIHLGWEGSEAEADAVILATGRYPDLTADVPPGTGETVFFPSHLGAQNLDELPLDETVHILGSSLSAYDVVNRLFSPTTGCRFEPGACGDPTFVPGPNQRNVVLCSRSGRLKKMQSRARRNLDRLHFTRQTNVAETAIESHSLSPDVWETTIDLRRGRPSECRGGSLNRISSGR